MTVRLIWEEQRKVAAWLTSIQVTDFLHCPNFSLVFVLYFNVNKTPTTSVNTFLDHPVYKSVFESLHANFEVLRRKVYHKCAVAQGLDTGLSLQIFWFM